MPARTSGIGAEKTLIDGAADASRLLEPFFDAGKRALSN